MKDSNLSQEIQNFLELPSTICFLQSARQFISIWERQNIENSDLLKRLHSALIVLYAAGSNLQQIDLKYSSADSDFDDKKLFEQRPEFNVTDFGEHSWYWQIFDPTYLVVEGEPGAGWQITEREPSQGWLVDDFTDIYRDLKISINKIDLIHSDEAIEDGFWELKWSFIHHWGQHCIDALRYLHYLSYDGKLTM